MKPLFPSDTDELAPVSTAVASISPAPMVAALDAGSLPTVVVASSPPAHINMARVTFSDDEIDQLGKVAGAGVAQVTKKLLTTIRAADSDVFGEQLNELIATAKGLDPKKLKTAGGLLTRVMNAFGSAKEAMLAQYQVVESRMDVLITEMEGHGNLHKGRVQDLEGLYLENHGFYLMLSADVAKGQEALAAIDYALTLTPSATDVFAAQAFADLKRRRERLDKRIDDLRRGMMVANQVVPKLRLSQDNARGLADTFTGIVVVGIPVWRGTFTEYLLQLEAKQSAVVANSAYDAINAALVSQADMLGQNVEDIAKLKQRSLFEFATLEHSQKSLIGMLDKADAIAAEGRARRAAEMPQLQQLEQELLQRFVATSNT